jgi:FixJ family two-component response regulator
MGRTPTVAIVDDEPAVRKSLCRLLIAKGMIANAYESGREFLEAVAENTPDCIILDIHMPLIGGVEVRDLMEQAGLHIPIVFITGQESDEIREALSTRQYSSFLRKPLDEQVLLSAINKAIVGTN